ncbi:hypothetical protein FQA47_022134 [Oryzias melastigma]|uniref:Uncharacterized protein n=1 Tax=Oryzias melastigma TaxID=30732 RepID=A0A834FMY5_ORYME|nr:hypothetical protein FQA47_022134 [Oryzias melastigma]
MMTVAPDGLSSKDGGDNLSAAPTPEPAGHSLVLVWVRWRNLSESVYVFKDRRAAKEKQRAGDGERKKRDERSEERLLAPGPANSSCHGNMLPATQFSAVVGFAPLRSRRDVSSVRA